MTPVQATLPHRVYPTCQAVHDPQARFCQICGTSLIALGPCSGLGTILALCVLIGGVLAVVAALLPWGSFHAGLAWIALGGFDIDNGLVARADVVFGGVPAAIEVFLLAIRRHGGRILGAVDAICAVAILYPTFVVGRDLLRYANLTPVDDAHYGVAAGPYVSIVAAALLGMGAVGRLIRGRRA